MINFFRQSKKDLQLSAYKYANENLLADNKLKDEAISKLSHELEMAVEARVMFMILDEGSVDKITIIYNADYFSLTGTLMLYGTKEGLKSAFGEQENDKI